MLQFIGPQTRVYLIVMLVLATSAGAALAKDQILGQPFDATDGPTAGGFTLYGSGWDGPGLGSAAVKYYFVNGTPDIAGTAEKTEILRAMDLWSKYADITWSPAAGAGENTSVDIGWYTGAHGDGHAFDGPGGVLAHAFYPTNSETIAGDMHFDEDETWTTGYLADRNVFYIAVHELGHSVGIDHSGDDKAVMAPVYYGGTIGDALPPDDISAIRALY
ncbi:hypothetical protein LCGC14_2775250, partial [marine sediment metagenome]